MGGNKLHANGHTWEVYMEPVEVTSLHRPDPDWTFTDSAGHIHRWDPPGAYRPLVHYSLPTLKGVTDFAGVYDEQGEMLEPPIWHWECRQCGQRVDPGYTADQYRQYVAGLKHYLIDDRHVSFEEFKRFAIEAGMPWAEGLRP